MPLATTPVRLDEDIMEAARKAVAITKRSAPKQIEYWIEIGRALDGKLDAQQIEGIRDGDLTVSTSPNQ